MIRKSLHLILIIKLYGNLTIHNIRGNNFTLADIMLFCFLNFGATVGQAISEDCTNLLAWFERVKARSSASA